jgi:hypothetical protein
MTPDEFATKARAFCTWYHGSVTSWGRTVKHNEAVGSKLPAGPHTRWLAIDIVYDAPVDLDEAKRSAAALGLQLIREGTHDHLQAEP